MKKTMLSGALLLSALMMMTGCEQLMSNLDNPVSPYLELQSSATVIALGETDTIKASTISTMPIQYASSDESVVKVDENGILTPVADGDATITVKVDQDPSKAYQPGETKFEVKVRTPLTLEALEDGQINVSFVYGATLDKPIYYTIGKEKKAIDNEDTEIEVKKGDRVKFESANDHMADYGPYKFSYGTYNTYRYVNILPQTKSAVYGNVMSLITDGDFHANTTITQPYAFYSLFGNAKMMVNHETYKLRLPAITLSNYCYGEMFRYCSGLTEAPELPATDLKPSCYYYMFFGCSGLTESPVLPATELAFRCYYSMFQKCTSLTKVHKLPAMTLKSYCYAYMFQECTALTQTPELPATEMANSCYDHMFANCTALTKAHKLPATDLSGGEGCYWGMFRKCIALTQAPELPATTLERYCYYGMFEGCTALTEGPVLPAKQLVMDCYMRMFYDCINLKSLTCLVAPTGGAYESMSRWLYNAGTNADSPQFKHAPEHTSWVNSDNLQGYQYPDQWNVPNYWKIVD